MSNLITFGAYSLFVATRGSVTAADSQTKDTFLTQDRRGGRKLELTDINLLLLDLWWLSSEFETTLAGGQMRQLNRNGDLSSSTLNLNQSEVEPFFLLLNLRFLKVNGFSSFSIFLVGSFLLSGQRFRQLQLWNL